MRAAIYHGSGDVRIEDVAEPGPAPGEVVVQVHAAGICGTDAAEFRDGPHWYRVPDGGHIPGHEFAGLVVALGPGSDPGMLGQQVACGAVIPCRRCRPCTRGRPGACVNLTVVGAQRPGGLAEYCAVPAGTCYPLAGHGLSTDVGALAQPTAVAVHAWSRGGAAAGDRVLVVAAGAIGALIGLVSDGSGAEVTMCDVDTAALERAARLCRATTLLAGGVGDGGDGGDGALPGRAYDVVLECSGTAAGLRAAVHAVRPAGRVVVVGHQPRPVELDLRELTRLEIDLAGTNALDPGADLDGALQVLAGRDIAVWRALAPRLIPLDQLVPDGLGAIGTRGTAAAKVLIDPRTREPRPLGAPAG